VLADRSKSPSFGVLDSARTRGYSDRTLGAGRADRLERNMPIGRHLCALAMPVSLALALTCAACSNASVGGSDGEGTGVRADAAGIPDAGGDGSGPDAAAPDGAGGGGPLTLSQSNSLDIIGGVSVACFEAINSYYRVFDLNMIGVVGDLEVSKVTFGVEECVSGGVGLPATVVLSTLDGDLSLANLTLLASADTVIPDVALPPEGELGGALREVPIAATVPAGSVLVVEMTHRAFAADQSLLIGSNRAGKPTTFLRAPACDENEPTPAEEIEDEDGTPVRMDWVVVVEGDEVL